MRAEGWVVNHKRVERIWRQEGLRVPNEYTRESVAIVVARRIRSDDVLHCLAVLFAQHGAPEHLRSDNRPEFTAKALRRWLKRVGGRTLYIEPGSPWENGYYGYESFFSIIRRSASRCSALEKSVAPVSTSSSTTTSSDRMALER